MGFVAVTCPKCGGEVQVDESMTKGFCIYCGTPIVNENAVVGNVSIDRKDDVRNRLILLRTQIRTVGIERVSDLIDEVLKLDAECADAWRLKAASSYDAKSAAIYMENVVSGTEYGIFGEDQADLTPVISRISDTALDAMRSHDDKAIRGLIAYLEVVSPDCADIRHMKAFCAAHAGDYGGYDRLIKEAASLYVHCITKKAMVKCMSHTLTFRMHFGLLAGMDGVMVYVYVGNVQKEFCKLEKEVTYEAEKSLIVPRGNYRFRFVPYKGGSARMELDYDLEDTLMINCDSVYEISKVSRHSLAVSCVEKGREF